MKKTILLLVLSALALTASAQMISKPTFRPDWTFKAPAPENGTYIYVKESGEGLTKPQALNQAIAKVFRSTSQRIGVFVSTDEINRAVQSGTDMEVISRNMKVPVNKVCEFAVQDTTNYTWTVYVLCQVAKSGNIKPEFETSEECTKHAMFDERLKRWEEQEAKKAKDAKRAETKVNATAFAASLFIPGAGQMYKGNYTEGAFTLLGEGALIGGGVAMLMLSKNQHKVMQDVSGTLTLDDYMSAKNKYNAYRYSSYGLFGAAAIIYGVNLGRAWACKDKRKKRVQAFYPTVIPDQTSPAGLALGVGMNMRF